MKTCEECREQLGEDPTAHTGKYGYSYCDYCDKPMSQRISHQPRIATMQPEQPHDCQKSVEQIKYLLNELNYLKNQVEWLRDEVRNLEKKVERKDEKPLTNPGNWWEKRDIK